MDYNPNDHLQSSLLYSLQLVSVLKLDIRTRFMFGYEEVIERLKKRVEVNDTKAMSILGCHYRDGICMVYHKIVISR